MSMAPLTPEKNDDKIISSQLYNLVSHTNYGRYLIASEDIPANTVIIEETPLVLGPEACSPTVCIGCHQPITDENFQKCAQCSWPVCDSDCSKLSEHNKECLIFQKDSKKCGIPFELGTTPRYDLVLIARCLLMRDNNEHHWKILQNMEGHGNSRKNEQEPHHMAAIRYFSEVCELDFSKDDLHHIRGVILTNAINTQDVHGNTMRGIYPQISMLNHSCHPNVTLRSDASHKLFISSSVDIPKGETLHFSYVPPTEPIWKRKLDLWSIYRFDCGCQVCTDPTEMNTYFSSLRCEDCEDSFVTFEVSWNQNWTCSKCKRYSSFEEIANKSLEIFSGLFPEGSDVGSLEDIVRKIRKSTHQTHFLYLNLVQECQKFLVSEDVRSLELRVYIWQEILRIMTMIEPGTTRRRGIILLQLASSEFKLAMLLSGTNETVKQKKVQEAMQNVNESLNILNLEPENSTELRWKPAAVNLKKYLSSTMESNKL